MSERNTLGPNWVHLVAIGGTGMGALAALLKKQGCLMTGSDQGIYPPMSTFIEEAGIPYSNEYTKKNLEGSSWGFEKENPDLVIVGNAISRGNVEAEFVESLLKQKKTRRMSFAEALYEFAIKAKESFVVCGTHGKSTTSSLQAWALECLEEGPGFFVGGIPLNFNEGSRLGEGTCFVSEGDEYDTAYWDKVPKFLHYHPDYVLCTGIEFDHADIYNSLEDIEEAFLSLVERTGKMWVMVDDQSSPSPSSLKKLAQKIETKKIPLVRYGFSADSKYKVIQFEMKKLPWVDAEYGIYAQVELGRLGVGRFYSPLIGKYNLLNYLGVLATLIEAKKLNSYEEVQHIVKSFKGIKRRQELLFRNETRVVIDDFAHHPTAVRETLSGVSMKYPDFKIAAFFEPRSATSARNIFYQEYLEAFSKVNALFLRTSLKKNVPENERLKVDLLCQELKNEVPHINVSYSESIDSLLHDFHEYLEKNKSNKLLVLVMSNASFDGVKTKIVKTIS